MNRDDVIRMARDAGLGDTGVREGFLFFQPGTDGLERFAALVAAEIGIETHRRGYESGLRDGAIAERDACAKACDDDQSQAGEWTAESHVGGYFAARIRARGTK